MLYELLATLPEPIPLVSESFKTDQEPFSLSQEKLTRRDFLARNEIENDFRREAVVPTTDNNPFLLASGSGIIETVDVVYLSSDNEGWPGACSYSGIIGATKIDGNTGQIIPTTQAEQLPHAQSFFDANFPSYVFTIRTLVGIDWESWGTRESGGFLFTAIRTATKGEDRFKNCPDYPNHIPIALSLRFDIPQEVSFYHPYTINHAFR
jgi:hypothetical protein